MKLTVTVEVDVDPDAWDAVFPHRGVPFYESIAAYTALALHGPPVELGAMTLGRIAVHEHTCADPLTCRAGGEVR